VSACDGRADHLVDALGGIGRAAVPDREERQSTLRGWRGKVPVKQLAGDVGERNAASPRLAAKPGVDSVREHDRRTLHASSLALRCW